MVSFGPTPSNMKWQEGVAPIHLVVEHELHRATPGGTGGVKTIGNYAAVSKQVLFLDFAVHAFDFSF